MTDVLNRDEVVGWIYAAPDHGTWVVCCQCAAEEGLDTDRLEPICHNDLEYPDKCEFCGRPL